MAHFESGSEVTFVEVTVGELLNAFELMDVPPLDPNSEIPLAYAQRATIRLLELLGADEARTMVMRWESSPEVGAS